MTPKQVILPGNAGNSLQIPCKQGNPGADWFAQDCAGHQTVIQADKISPSGTLGLENGAVLRGLAGLNSRSEVRGAPLGWIPANKIAGFSVWKNPASHRFDGL